MKSLRKPLAVFLSLAMLFSAVMVMPLNANVVNDGTVSMNFRERARNNFASWDDFVANPAAIPEWQCSGHLADGGLLSTLRGVESNGIDFMIVGNRVVNSDVGFMRPNGDNSQFISTVYLQGPFTISIAWAPFNSGPTNGQIAGLLLPQGQTWTPQHEDEFFARGDLAWNWFQLFEERQEIVSTFDYTGTGIYTLVLGINRGEGGDTPDIERTRTRWHNIEITFHDAPAVPEPTPAPAAPPAPVATPAPAEPPAAGEPPAAEPPAAEPPAAAEPPPAQPPAAVTPGAVAPPTGDAATIWIAAGTFVVLAGLIALHIARKRRTE